MAEQHVTLLKKEVDGLMMYVERVRKEIAAMDRPADEDHQMESMNDQLDAIVSATEEASNTIMNAMESTSDAVFTLSEQITDPEQLKMLDRITNNANDVFEACSFQDITGQRVTKLVRSLAYVADRVDSLITLWGRDQLGKVDVVAHEKTADEALLRGPALEGEGMAQDEIDKLFD